MLFFASLSSKRSALRVLLFTFATFFLGACVPACTPPPCGGNGNSCCSTGTPCQAGLACAGGCLSTCQPCGGANEVCCTGTNRCRTGLECAGGYFSGICRSCGGPGEPCCGATCSAGMVCAPSSSSTGGSTCQTCGGQGQPCCTGSHCSGSLECTAGNRCSGCGSSGEACCAGNRCDDGSVCELGSGTSMCIFCGGVGQPCCSSSTCTDPSLFCNGTTCQACGGLRQACCPGNNCTTGACVAGVCTGNFPDASTTPTACTAATCPGATDVCLPFPSAVCSHHCTIDHDCGVGGACFDGLCEPSCTPGAMQCDPYGGACFNGIAPYTALDAPAAPTRAACLPSCFPAGAELVAGYPSCASGTVCDPVTGGCLASAGTVTIGAPCASDRDCGLENARCFRPLDASGSATGFIGGYCVTLGRTPPDAAFVAGMPLPRSNCPSGSVIVPLPTARAGDVSACYAECTNDCDCREGYACDHDPLRMGATATNGACLPIDCTSFGEVCPGNGACQLAGPFAHTLHAVCHEPDADAGYVSGARNTGCAAPDGGDVDGASADGDVDATVDDAMDAEVDATTDGDMDAGLE